MNEEVTYNLLAWGGGYGPKGGETYIYFCEEPPFLVPNGLNIGEQKIYKQGGYFIDGSSMKTEVAYIVSAWVGAMYLERGNTRKNFIGRPPTHKSSWVHKNG